MELLYYSYTYLSLSILFLVGVLSFVLNKTHLLSSLISLEYMVLILFMTMSLFNMVEGVASLSLAFLTVSVCEGALGLSVLVTFARTFGNESLEAMTTNMW